MSNLWKFFLCIGWLADACPFRGIGDLLDAGRINFLARSWNRKTEDPTVLITDDQAVFIIHTHGNP